MQVAALSDRARISYRGPQTDHDVPSQKREEAMTSSQGRSYAKLFRISRLAGFVAFFTSPTLAHTSPGVPRVLAPRGAPELVQGGVAGLERPARPSCRTVY